LAALSFSSPGHLLRSLFVSVPLGSIKVSMTFDAIVVTMCNHSCSCYGQLRFVLHLGATRNGAGRSEFIHCDMRSSITCVGDSGHHSHVPLLWPVCAAADESHRAKLDSRRSRHAVLYFMGLAEQGSGSGYQPGLAGVWIDPVPCHQKRRPSARPARGPCSSACCEELVEYMLAMHLDAL